MAVVEGLLVAWEAFPFVSCLLLLSTLAVISSLLSSSQCKLQEKATSKVIPRRKSSDEIITTPSGNLVRRAVAPETGCFGLTCCFARPSKELSRPLSNPDLSSGVATRKYGPDAGATDYDTLFGHVEEDAAALVEAVVPRYLDRGAILVKLQELKRRVADLTASGWLRPDDNRVLLRFLRARQDDVDKAEEMLRKTHAWRAEVDADRALADWDRTAFHATDPYWKPFGIMGHDKDGDPILFERLGNCHVPSLDKMGEVGLVKHEIYTNERVMAVLERERLRHLKAGSHRGFQFTVIEDLHGLGPSHASVRGLAMYKTLVRIDEDHYPEIIKRVLLVRAPWIFQVIWKVAQHFFDEGTRDKICIVSTKNTAVEITKHVSMREVPALLGGELCVDGDPACGGIIAQGGPVPQSTLDRHFAR